MGALAALAVKILDPELTILYGCAGSINEELLPIGSVLLTESVFHLDRFRTKD